MTAAEFQALFMGILDGSSSADDALMQLQQATAGHQPWSDWVGEMDPDMVHVGCELMGKWGARTQQE